MKLSFIIYLLTLVSFFVIVFEHEDYVKDNLLFNHVNKIYNYYKYNSNHQKYFEYLSKHTNYTINQDLYITFANFEPQLKYNSVNYSQSNIPFYSPHLNETQRETYYTLNNIKYEQKIDLSFNLQIYFNDNSCFIELYKNYTLFVPKKIQDHNLHYEDYYYVDEGIKYLTIHRNTLLGIIKLPQIY